MDTDVPALANCMAVGCNVLKPVPQPPSGTRNRLEGGLWNQKLDAVFLVAQTMSMRSIDPNRRWGSRGEEQPPWWGLGRSPKSWQQIAHINTNLTLKIATFLLR